jgi:hypothetical protein
MPTVNLSGTPNVRYPDPLIKRVAPNGTQPLSAYNAACLYFDSKDSVWLGDIQVEFGGVRLVDVLLFGTDYPALVTATSYYGENVDGLGNYFPTFNESNPVFGSLGASKVPFLLPTAPAVGYKQIATGITATSGLRVQGFPHRINTVWHGVVRDDPPTQDAPFVLGLSVLMNASVVNSSTTFVDADTGLYPNMPVIIHERDLTQQIIDNRYVIPAQIVDLTAISYVSQINANLEVVGLWATDYLP